MDKQEMIRRTKYDRLRKSYGTDRVIEKEVYLAYYNKLLTRVQCQPCGTTGNFSSENSLM